jgi:hypothetical protein
VLGKSKEGVKNRQQEEITEQPLLGRKEKTSNGICPLKALSKKPMYIHTAQIFDIFWTMTISHLYLLLFYSLLGKPHFRIILIILIIIFISITVKSPDGLTKKSPVKAVLSSNYIKHCCFYIYSLSFIKIHSVVSQKNFYM